MQIRLVLADNEISDKALTKWQLQLGPANTNSINSKSLLFRLVFWRVLDYDVYRTWLSVFFEFPSELEMAEFNCITVKSDKQNG